MIICTDIVNEEGVPLKYFVSDTEGKILRLISTGEYFESAYTRPNVSISEFEEADKV